MDFTKMLCYNEWKTAGMHKGGSGSAVQFRGFSDFFPNCGIDLLFGTG